MSTETEEEIVSGVPEDATFADWDAAIERGSVEEPDTEQPQPGDDETAAEADPGETTEDAPDQEPDSAPEPDETPQPVAEGPTFLMKQAAISAGIPEDWVDRATSDDQLQFLMENLRAHAGKSRPEPEPEPELQVELPEDEYGPDDPVRKNLQKFADALKSERAERRRIEQEYQQTRTALEEQQYKLQHRALYSKFDEVLDSFNDPRFGNSKTGVSAKQGEYRRIVAEKYHGLGASPEMPDEDKEWYTLLAAQAYDKKLVEQRNKRQQQAARQRQSVLGGAPSKPSPKATGDEELLAQWDQALQGRRPAEDILGL